jgi:tetratricopeptide (TPR) repeat protein
MENLEGSGSFHGWEPSELVRRTGLPGIARSQQSEQIRTLAAAVLQASASAQVAPQEVLIQAIHSVRHQIDLFGDTQQVSPLSFLTNLIGLTEIQAKRFSNLQEVFVNYLALFDAEISRLTEAHDYDTALRMLELLRNVVPDPSFIPMRKSKIYALRGQYQQSTAELEALLPMLPQTDSKARASCFAEIGRNYAACNNFLKAYESLCAALNLDPNNESYHREVLEILLNPAVLQQTGPAFIEGYFNSIASALQNEDFIFPQDAFKSLIQSLQRLYEHPSESVLQQPGTFRILTESALGAVSEILFRQGKYGLVQSLAQLGTPVFQTPLWRARIFALQGQYQQAAAEFESLLTSIPLSSSKDRADCLLAIGRNYAASGNIPKAYEAFCNAINIDPNNDAYHLELVQTLFNPLAIQRNGFIYIQDYISSLINASRHEGFQFSATAYQFLVSSLHSQGQSLPLGAPLEDLKKAANQLEIDWILKNLPTCSLSKLTEEDKQKLQPVIRFAIGNRELNKALGTKKTKTKLEKFLYSLSFYTQDSLHPIVSRINDSLDQTGLRLLRQNYDQLSQGIENLQRQLAHYLSTYRASYPEQELGAMQAWVAALTCLRYLPSVEQTLTTHRQALAQLATARLPQETIAQIVAASARLDEFAQARQQILARGAALLQDPSSQGPVRPQDMHIIEECDHHLVDKLDWCKPSGGFTDPVVLELHTDVAAARTLGKEAGSLLQILPSYMPGDVLVQDEVRYNAFTGSSKQLYSTLSPYRMSTWGSLLHGIVQKGVFGIQPFFTGAEKHTALVNAESGEMTKLEIVRKYRNEPLEFSTSLIDVCYRPKFMSQLTPEGLSAITEIYPGATQDQYEQWLSTLNAKCLYDHVTANTEEFEALQNDGMRAMLEWVRSKIPGVIEPYVSLTATKTSELYEFLAKHLRFHPVAPEQQEEFVKIFCSEFNARVIVAVQKHLDSMLNTMLSQKMPGHPPVSFFKPIIPPSFKLEAINPGRLKQIILASGYSEVPPPVAAQLLCGRRIN